MKKLFLISCILLFMAGTASAASLPWALGVENFFEDNSGEILINTGGADNTYLEIGDTLSGVFDFHEITQPNTYDLVGNGVELTGVFEVVVTDRTLISGTPGTGDAFFDYTFGPSATFEATYAALGYDFTGADTDLMAVFYLDDTPDLDVHNDSVADAFLNATDGLIYWLFGVDDRPTDAPDTAGWSISNAPEDVSLFATVDPSITVVSTRIALDLLESVTGPDLDEVALDFFPADGTDDFYGIELIAELNLQGTEGTGTEFDVFDNMQAKIKPIPEPATISLLGFGLLTAAFIGRRRFQLLN